MISPENRVLLRLNESSIVRGLLPQFERVAMTKGEMLLTHGAPVHHVYFPESGYVVRSCALCDGRSAEVGAAGRNGVVGAFAVVAEGGARADATVQMGGEAFRIRSKLLRGRLRNGDAAFQVLVAYCRRELIEAQQLLLCNAHHTLARRLACWLLLASNRAHTVELSFNHEQIAEALGVQRSGVTVLLGRFKDAGLVSTSRGCVTILERNALEGAACECYAVLRRYNSH